MRKLRNLGLGLLIVTAVGVGFYFFAVYDPDAPRSDWPVLQAAEVGNDAFELHVAPNVQVTAKFEHSRFEFPDIAAAPNDESRLFAAALRWRGKDLDLFGFYSHDGGATWQVGCKLIAPRGMRHSDLSIAYGPNGNVYLAYMKYDHPKKPGLRLGAEGGRVELLASSDAGVTWRKAAVLTSYIDRPWLAVDTTSGVHRGRMYFFGNIDEPIFYSAEAESLALAVPLTPLQGRKLLNCRHANPAVTDDGTVVLVCEDHILGPGKARYRPRLLTWRSIDGGRTLDEAAPVNTNWSHAVIESSRGHTTMWPRLAANSESAAFANRVYCVWADGHFDDERIFITSSDDAGATWRQPVVISEQPMDNTGGFMAFHPSVAVNSNGVVAVSWYDRRGLPKPEKVPTDRQDVFEWSAPGWNVRCRASMDGGATWLPSVQLSEQPGQGEFSAEVGHSAGLTAGTDGRFHAAWIDNRTGKSQLWTTAIAVIPKM
jgi:hypothetical protein